MNIDIICIGKLKEKYIKEACDEYTKRLNRFCKINIKELPEARLNQAPSQKDIERAVIKEGEDILSQIPPNSFVIALCVEGLQLSSTELAGQIAQIGIDGKSSIAFIIGGSEGLSSNIKNICHIRLSFSKMTFPHQLMRVFLLEQIYRAFKINANETYHK